jgi:uncharacterized repeat protein (TIGR03803 family)
MKKTSSFWMIASILFVTVASAAERQKLQSRAPEAVARLHLQPIGRLPSTNRLNLVIGLPLRNQADLGILMGQLYDPASTNFHRYLTPAQFTAKFGPTEADYQAVINFAKTNGLQVVGTYDSRVMLDVSATVSDIEKAFHVTLRTYQHPTEPRQFYAPDVEASVDTSLPILSVSGLDNYVLPHPMAHLKTKTGTAVPATGTGPGGNYRGYDFRNAYAPGVSLTGTGQNLGLVEFEGYYASDITTYENQAGLPNVPLQIYFMDGYNSGNTPNPNDTNGVAECSLDIEMVISMAPGLTKLYVFEGNVTDHILGSMVTNTQINQFSSSWGMNNDATAAQYLQQMQTQGQSFFQASGDGDAYVTFPIYWPADDPNVTSVGGTELTMNGSGASYGSETVWNSGFDANGPWCCNGQNSNNAYWGSGGGVSSIYSIPFWQQSVNMTAVGGSSSMRYLPDVALTADDVWVNYMNGLSGSFMGTSCAAPLWAGFTALVNEQATNQSVPSVGFINPALYAIAQSSVYTSCFHDTTTGNNTWPGSPSKYYSATGYDLCTGWGTPTGSNLINSLTGARRIISVTGNLNFGSVQEGTTAQRTLTIWSEGGNANLDVSSISYPNGFSGAWSGTIWLDGSVNVTVTFSPTAITSYGGTVTVNSDRTSGVNTIAASGAGISTLPPPVSPFPIAPFSVVYSFPYAPGPWASGSNPEAGLVQGSDGNFYGTTTYGGASGWGVVFRLTASGNNQTLYSFPGRSGGQAAGYPVAPLIQGTDGNFYGTTKFGGVSFAGSVFQITSGGSFANLYSFRGLSDGCQPMAPLIQATDGNFYGTSSGCGNGCGGTAFKMTSSGAFTLLNDFGLVSRICG